MEIVRKDEFNPHYQQIIERRGVTRLMKLSQFDEILNLSSLSREDPEIFIETDAIIIFDNPDFNTAYILDEFERFSDMLPFYDRVAKEILPIPGLDKETFEVSKKSIFDKINKTAKEIKVFYCDNEELHTSLFEPFVAGRNLPTANPPAMLMISPKNAIVFVDMELLYPLDVKKFIMAYLMLHDAHEAKAQMAAAETARKEAALKDVKVN